MEFLKLIPTSDPRLTAENRKVHLPLKEALVIAAKATMLINSGIGLAAPQVGINARWMIVDNTLMVNPKLLSQSDITTKQLEGCLSLPGIEVEVTRAYSVEVSYENIDLEERFATLEGMAARVFLHELDHLNGTLITSYLPSEVTPG